MKKLIFLCLCLFLFTVANAQEKLWDSPKQAEPIAEPVLKKLILTSRIANAKPQDNLTNISISVMSPIYYAIIENGTSYKAGFRLLVKVNDKIIDLGNSIEYPNHLGIISSRLDLDDKIKIGDIVTIHIVNNDNDKSIGFINVDVVR